MLCQNLPHSWIHILFLRLNQTDDYFDSDELPENNQKAALFLINLDGETPFFFHITANSLRHMDTRIHKFRQGRLTMDRFKPDICSSWLWETSWKKTEITQKKWRSCLFFHDINKFLSFFHIIFSFSLVFVDLYASKILYPSWSQKARLQMFGRRKPAFPIITSHICHSLATNRFSFYS